jgi:hypothetical protein
MAQEVASERFVAFASGKKQVIDALKVHALECSHLRVPPVKGRSILLAEVDLSLPRGG